MKKRNSSISTKQRNLSLRQTVDCKFYLQRLYFSVTHKALPIICVTFEVVYLCNNLLSKVIELLGSHFNRENYIEPVAYCFNCQKFGHISTNCFNNTCEYCVKNHSSQQPCLQESLCISCIILGHPSTLWECVTSLGFIGSP